MFVSCCLAVAILMLTTWVALLDPFTVHEQQLVVAGIGVWAVGRLGYSVMRWLARPGVTTAVVAETTTAVEQSRRPGTGSRPLPSRDHARASTQPDAHEDDGAPTLEELPPAGRRA